MCIHIIEDTNAHAHVHARCSGYNRLCMSLQLSRKQIANLSFLFLVIAYTSPCLTTIFFVFLLISYSFPVFICSSWISFVRHIVTYIFNKLVLKFTFIFGAHTNSSRYYRMRLSNYLGGDARKPVQLAKVLYSTFLRDFNTHTFSYTRLRIFICIQFARIESIEIARSTEVESYTQLGSKRKSYYLESADLGIPLKKRHNL